MLKFLCAENQGILLVHMRYFGEENEMSAAVLFISVFEKYKL